MLTYSWRQKILFTLLNSCTGQVQTSKIPSYLTKFQSIKESMNFLVFFFNMNFDLLTKYLSKQTNGIAYENRKVPKYQKVPNFAALFSTFHYFGNF